MVRVTEKGVYWTVRCKNCSSILEADVKDVRGKRFDGVMMQYITCPVCTSLIMVPKEKEIRELSAFAYYEH